MELAEARRALEKKRFELLQRERQLEADIRRQKDPLSADSEEQATQKENDDVLDALDGEARAEIQQIDLALDRIAAGSYYDCSACGQKIDRERRNFLIDATLCISCASK
jgi:RNA polymerase-binding transcription factor DksA